MMRRFLVQSIYIGAVLIIFSVRSYAQSGIAPGMIEKNLEQSRPVFGTPPEEKAPEIIIKDSRKLKDPGAGPAFLVKKIIIEGNTLISDEILAPLVDVEGGMEVTLGILALMATEITALYATKGYFLTRAFVPQQEIFDGVVKIKVMEGRIGKITVKGNKKYDAKDFLNMMKSVQEEKVLREQTLENKLLELNSMLGIKARSILRRGELPGTSDLVLDVTESSRYLFSYDMDNFGSLFTGQNRFGLNGTVGNILTLGDQFSTRWVTSDMVQDSYSP
ncbi:MAG: ShlB/FhaC/HecB family hemolysin secretion/activation protein, partial [Nitrospina sp.]|nr:ShlB/FhaC/HecB family hemolysin secretion/activation protein [Nitrospina sp.]